MHMHKHYGVPWWVWRTAGYLSYTVDQLSDGILDCRALNLKLAAASQKKKRGLYLSFTPMEKARVVLYSGAVSVEFKQLCDDLAEN